MNRKDTARPARIMRSGPWASPRFNSMSTVAVANMPPVNAETGNVQIPNASPVTVMTVTAPAAAPADNPNRNGSARSLRVTVCSIAPTTPSPTPTQIVSSTLGKRRSTTMRPIGPSGTGEPSLNASPIADTTSAIGIGVGPYAMEDSARMMTARTAAIIDKPKRLKGQNASGCMALAILPIASMLAGPGVSSA